MRITLKEAIYGSLATVFHRSKEANPKSFKIFPGKTRTGVAIFGGGFYTTYNLQDQLTDRMIKNYGEYIFKFAIKTDSFFIMDGKERKKNFNKLNPQQKKALEEIEKIVENDDDFNKWEDDGHLIYVINKYSEVDNLIRLNFDGIIYTSKDDGQCALIFNPTKSYTKILGVTHAPDKNINVAQIKWRKL